ncbi:MAG TPA: peptidylprolyl isomerase [Candidatus Polarisedimenticolaceae bacterium]
MLNVFRENLRHLKWVLWVVAFSMVLYLGAFFIDDPGAPADSPDAWAVKVGDHTVSTQAFLEEARRRDEFYRRLLGAQYDQMRGSLRLGSQVAESLVDRQIMLVEAKSLGLAAGADELSRRILEDPNFKDASGNFIGRERYVELLNTNWNGGVAAYEAALMDEIAIQKWVDLVTEPAQVGEPELEKAYRDRNERAAFDYLFFSLGDQKVSTDVSDAEARAYWAANPDRFRSAEGRKVKLLVVDRQAQASKATVTDADVRKYYDDNLSQFSRPEQRRASHILFRVEAGAAPEDRRSIRDLAESVLKRAQGGEDFAALARAMSQDQGSAPNGGDLGWFGRGDMVPAFDQAAFSTPPGQLAPVVETEFGYHVIKVAEQRDAGATPFEEVQAGIRRQVELRKQQEVVESEAKRLHAAISGLAQLDEVAAKEGLKVEERVIARDETARELGPSPEFTNGVFSTAPGSVAAPAAIARGMAIAGIVDVIPAAVRPYEQVSAQAKTEALAERQRQSALLAARRAASDLDAAARSAKLEVKKSGDVSPGFALPGPGRSPELETAIFAPSTAVGATGAVATPGGAVAYRVTRHDAFDRARFESQKSALRTELLQQRRQVLLDGVLTSLRRRYDVRINDPIVQRANG